LMHQELRRPGGAPSPRVPGGGAGARA
jgi:hypothetical protein